MVDAKKRPQILQYLCKSLTSTVYDARWVPSSARFVALGSTVHSKGCIQVYELNGTELQELVKVEKPESIKCGTFEASSLVERHLATGDFKGNLHIWNLERLETPIFHAKTGHETIINAIDGCGGLENGCGAPEIVTGGRDGCVYVWDPRQNDAPVASFGSESRDSARDCWAVAFGNSYNDEERCILAGYNNGDIKLFDLRTGTVRLQTRLSSGICGLQFNHKHARIDKFVAATLGSQFHVFDLHDGYSSKGHSFLTETMSHGKTLWGVKHLPQNPEVFMVYAGDGSLSLYKYTYLRETAAVGSKGSSQMRITKPKLLSSRVMSTQPVLAFDWNLDKGGLAVMCSFDQFVRVIIVKQLQQV
eukprot:TRINITY_DN12035_c0_g1_i1.p1 TRINITY_DN12035_c0_g1~~TRINITY_DN12035_c0_g1_i1.p1  ORF type:complete len:361 (-),score=66.19 TRINITY_DN12035_c0_g1_i1:141-1223(-)